MSATGLYDDLFVGSLKSGLESLTDEWSLSGATDIRLLTVSENATFLADDPARPSPLVLRVYRPGYHERREIESELAWIGAIRAQGVATVAAPVACRNGDHVAGLAIGGAVRHVVAFEFLEGVEPAANENLVRCFAELGAISARLHEHAMAWQRPRGFVRKTWNFETTVGTRPVWGDWRAGLGLCAEGQAILERCAGELRADLARFGAGPARFGLIHADLRLANLLIDATGRIGLIDFDDCGFGWFMYDFAAAVSFFEHDPQVRTLQGAWVDGYRTVRPLDAEEEAMLPTFVMLRRLLLTAWIASHPETPTAAELGAGYTSGTIDLAERFLTG